MKTRLVAYGMIRKGRNERCVLVVLDERLFSKSPRSPESVSLFRRLAGRLLLVAPGGRALERAWGGLCTSGGE